MNELNTQPKNKQLDKEWIKLMIEAKNIGLSLDEIQKFLHIGSSSKDK